MKSTLTTLKLNNFLPHALVFTMTKKDNGKQSVRKVQDDEELDEWDIRINRTGCAEENIKLLNCHYDKKDWRQCIKEMEDFRNCWKVHGNDKRTSMKDLDEKAKP